MISSFYPQLLYHKMKQDEFEIPIFLLPEHIITHDDTT